MNIYQFLKTKLTSKPATLSPSEIGTVTKDKQSLDLLKKFGLVQTELHKAIADTTLINWERQGVYQSVDRSLAHPLMCAAVGLYADYASTPSQLFNSTVWVTTESREYKYQIEKLFDVINLEEVVYDWLWTLATFGDLFVQVHGQPGIGVVSISDDQHPINVSRVDYQGRLVGFYETPLGYASPDERKLLPPWEYIHGRLLGAKKRRSQHMDNQFTEFRTISIMTPDDRRLTSKYGTSILLDALPTWKRLRLAEDSILMARINRGVLRYIYSIAVGNNQNPEAVASLIDNYVEELKRARALDTTQGAANYQDKFNAMCLVGDTRIALLDHTNPTIQDMAENKEKYVGKYVWSVNPKSLKLEPKKITGVLPTRKNAELVRVHLDNNQHVDCTPDHKFMMRDGSFTQAQFLSAGDSLMPHYEEEYNGYKKVYDPFHKRYIPEHKLVMKRLTKKSLKGMHVHHKHVEDPDNKLNNDPSNLQSMTKAKHMKLHGDYRKGKTYSEVSPNAATWVANLSASHKGIKYTNRKKHTPTKDVIAKMVAARSIPRELECEYCGEKWIGVPCSLSGHKTSCKANPSYMSHSRRIKTEMRECKCGCGKTFEAVTSRKHFKQFYSRQCANSYNEPIMINHKVVRVERLSQRQDTYDLQVEDNHNFPISAGVFVHNSNMEDIIIPVWGDVNNIKIDKIGGEVDIKWIVDIEELRNQLATALRVPLGLLSGYSKEGVQGSIGSNSIERMDIRFARQARRLQRSLINMLTRMVQVHLSYQGIDPDLNLFKIQMTETSSAEEEELKSALDKGVDVVDKLSDLVIKCLGEVDTDKKALLDYLNKKFLKLNDMDLSKLLLKGNPNAFKENDRTQPVAGLEDGKSAETAKAEQQLKEPNPFREDRTLSDFKAASPLNEAQWNADWGSKTVKITPKEVLNS